MVFGVKSCSNRSPAQINPPPFPRTSMMSPSVRCISGSSISRRNSLTNAESSCTLKVKIRTYATQKVIAGFCQKEWLGERTTERARAAKTSGMVESVPPTALDTALISGHWASKP